MAHSRLLIDDGFGFAAHGIGDGHTHFRRRIGIDDETQIIRITDRNVPWVHAVLQNVDGHHPGFVTQLEVIKAVGSQCPPFYRIGFAGEDGIFCSMPTCNTDSKAATTVLSFGT